MAEPVTFRSATRENVFLVVGFAGPSGGGKTKSAMLLAQGIVGRDKKFAVIDTETRRALHYAPLPGEAPDFVDTFHFDHVDLRPPFRPEAYANALRAAEKARYGAIVVDSFSHVWEGEGGILDWHDQILSDRVKRAMEKSNNDTPEWRLRESYNQLAWVDPKMAHKLMVQRDLLQLRAHVILCMRAEDKIEMVREGNQTVMRPKKTLSGFEGWIPICEKRLPFELTASFVLTPDKPGHPKAIKCNGKHRPFFPEDKPVSEDAGRRLAEWARGGSAQSKPETTAERLAAARTRLSHYTDEQWETLGAAKLGAPLKGAPDEEIDDKLLPFLRQLAGKNPAALGDAAKILGR